MQIERHGLNRNPEIGPIAKASFEEVMTILTQAAVFAEKDNMKGVSANILAGQFCKSGTNCFEILIDEEKMLEPMEETDIMENNNIIEHTPEKINALFDKTFDKKEKDENVKDDAFEFGFGMENDEEKMLSKMDESKIKIVDNGKENKSISFNVDELTLDEIIENEVEDINNNTLNEDTSDDTNDDTSDINNLTLEEIKDNNNETDETDENHKTDVTNEINEDNKTLNTETIIEVKPKKRGRPKKVIVENLEK